MTRAILGSSRAACAPSGAATVRSHAQTTAVIATLVRIQAMERASGPATRDSLLSRAVGCVAQTCRAHEGCKKDSACAKAIDVRRLPHEADLEGRGRDARRDGRSRSQRARQLGRM